MTPGYIGIPKSLSNQSTQPYDVFCIALPTVFTPAYSTPKCVTARVRTVTLLLVQYLSQSFSEITTHEDHEGNGMGASK